VERKTRRRARRRNELCIITEGAIDHEPHPSYILRALRPYGRNQTKADLVHGNMEREEAFTHALRLASGQIMTKAVMVRVVEPAGRGIKTACD
jgi:hypothetical protein